jgi:hypothetical protein
MSKLTLSSQIQHFKNLNSTSIDFQRRGLRLRSLGEIQHYQVMFTDTTDYLLARLPDNAAFQQEISTPALFIEPQLRWG